MYVGPYAICVLNWNWLITQDHFLIEHWSQRTHRCSARVVGLEEYSLVLVSRYSTVRSGTLTWREWGLWLSPCTVINTNLLLPVHCCTQNICVSTQENIIQLSCMCYCLGLCNLLEILLLLMLVFTYGSGHETGAVLLLVLLSIDSKTR